MRRVDCTSPFVRCSLITSVAVCHMLLPNGATAPTALAQPSGSGQTGFASQPINAGGTQWQQVRPGSSDLSPLSLDLRYNPQDLRQPTSFEGVYQLSTDPQLLGRVPGAGQGLFARFSNGMAAVFRQSEYSLRPKDGALVTEVPAGTIFMTTDSLKHYLEREGLTPRPLDSTPSATAMGNAMGATDDRRLDLTPKAVPSKRASQPVGGAPQRSPWGSELERARRVGVLLDEAFNAR